MRGLLPPLFTIVKVPDCEPPAEGTKVTLTLQLPPAESGAPQLFVALNSALAATLEMVNEVVPVLVMTMVWAALVLATVVAGKASDDGTS